MIYKIDLFFIKTEIIIFILLHHRNNVLMAFVNMDANIMTTFYTLKQMLNECLYQHFLSNNSIIFGTIIDTFYVNEYVKW